MDSVTVLSGGGWVRTTVGRSQQVYSLPPLATRARHRKRPQATSNSLRIKEIASSRKGNSFDMPGLPELATGIEPAT